MPYMVQAEIMHDHAIPISLFEFRGDMSRHIVINFSEVLMSHDLAFIYHSLVYMAPTRSTDRNEKARSPVCPRKGAGEELQPRVITVHDQLAIRPPFQLAWPSILTRQTRRLVRLGEVQDYVQERRNRTRRHGLDSWHGDGRRRRVSSVRHCRSISYQALREVEARWGRVDKVASERIHHHEDDFVKRSVLDEHGSFSIIGSKAWYEGLIGKEAGRKHNDGNGNQDVGEKQQ